MQKLKRLTKEQRYRVKLMLDQRFDQIESVEHIDIQQSKINRAGI